MSLVLPEAFSMFWKCNTLSTLQLDTLLEKDDLKLGEVLDQDEVIQEAKNQNKKLVDYLTGTEVLSELIGLIITEPPADLEDSVRFKHPHIAAELLTCEIPQINEKLSSEESLLNQLYSFMEQDGPLNPLLSSFFSKAFGVLMTRKSEQNWYAYQVTCIRVFEFLKKKDFIEHLLKHIGTSAISDLVLKLITCVEGTEMKLSMLVWLNEKKLIQSIIGLLDPKLDRDVHDNAAWLLVEILSASRDNQNVPINERTEDPILATLESPETAEMILDQIFSAEKNESTIVNGINILLALLDTRKPQTTPQAIYTATYNPEPEPGLTPEDIERQERVLDMTVETIVPRLAEFTGLLTDPPQKAALKTTGGVLDPPLGATRLSIAKLISALLATNNMSVNIELTRHNTIDILLDLFFKYSLNNFLHQHVEQCICHVFNWKQKDKNQPEDDDLDLFGENEKKDDDNDDDDEREQKKKNDTAESPATQLQLSSSSSSSPPPPRSPSSSSTTTSDEIKNDDGSSEKKDSDSTGAQKTLLSSSSNSSSSKRKSTTLENPLLVHLFSNCRLVERVLDAWEENELEESRSGFHRKGYMGHLTQIANVMHQNADKTECKDLILEQMKKLPESTTTSWNNFVNGKLAEINEKNTIVHPNSYSNMVSSSEDEDADFRDIQLPQDSLQQIFSDYQMQQMSEHFVDSFGFNNDEFADSDENGGSMRKLSNFSLEESNKGQQMFESVCEQKFGNFPDAEVDDEDEDEEDAWAERTREIRFSNESSEDNATTSTAATTARSALTALEKQGEEDDEDDEDKEDKDDWIEIVEPDPWGATSTTVAMDIGNPWDSKTSAETEVEGENAGEAWASFEESPSTKLNDSASSDFGSFQSSKPEEEEKRDEGKEPPEPMIQEDSPSLSSLSSSSSSKAQPENEEHSSDSLSSSSSSPTTLATARTTQTTTSTTDEAKNDEQIEGTSSTSMANGPNVVDIVKPLLPPAVEANGPC